MPVTAMPTLTFESNESTTKGKDWVGDITTLMMNRKDGRGGFEIHPVLAATGRTVGGKEELVPGHIDPFNHVNHSLAYHQSRYKIVKGYALPKGQKLLPRLRRCCCCCCVSVDSECSTDRDSSVAS